MTTKITVLNGDRIVDEIHLTLTIKTTIPVKDIFPGEEDIPITHTVEQVTNKIREFINESTTKDMEVEAVIRPAGKENP